MREGAVGPRVYLVTTEVCSPLAELAAIFVEGTLADVFDAVWEGTGAGRSGGRPDDAHHTPGGRRAGRALLDRIDRWPDLRDRLREVRELGAHADDPDRLRGAFHHWLTEYDRRCGLDPTVLFPDLADFWAGCARAAGDRSAGSRPPGAPTPPAALSLTPAR